MMKKALGQSSAAGYGTGLLKSATALICIAALFSVHPNAGALSPIPGDESRGNTEAPGGRAVYADYLKQYENAAQPSEPVEVPLAAFTADAGAAQQLSDYKGRKNCVYTGDTGAVKWTFDVPLDGLYNIAVSYYPAPGNGAAIERELRINGKIPFDGARSIVFDRLYINSGDKRVDSRGNETRPNQKEAPEWTVKTISAFSAYMDGSCKFYFWQGENTLELKALREPMVIAAITLFQAEEPEPYKTKSEEYRRMGYESPDVEPVYIQGEDAVLKSDPTLFPISDRTSPETQPYSLNILKLNTIGGLNWRYPGQWISWEADVPESGLYQLGVRAKQDYIEGTSSVRRLIIDGKAPAREFEKLVFPYNTSWVMNVPGGSDPCLLYLDKGPHTITLQNTLGDISPILQSLDASVYKLNEIYRSVLKITGVYPDPNRDYNFDALIPDAVREMETQRTALRGICDRIESLTGAKGQDYANIYRLVLQLDVFLKNKSMIASGLDRFRNNISAAAAWLGTASEQPLLIDYLILAPADSPLPKGDAAWYQKLWNEIKAFVFSFFTDYATVGEMAGGIRKATLWMGAPTGGAGAGRDQANVMKNLAESMFTPSSGVALDIKLVDMGMLLPAVASGMGPDAAIGQDRSIPVNYALRNAVYDLSLFDDIDAVTARFSAQAMLSNRFNGGVYGLPETEVFPMMFYRTDILGELGIEAPRTWDDVYGLLPILRNHYMDISLPNITDAAVSMDLFLTLLYQSGGQVYNDGLNRSELDNESGIAAFEKLTDFYLKYNVTKQADALTRFRTGEMPIVISPYTFYNSLAAAAPEIRGLWDFALVPGTVREDGSIDRSVFCSGTSCVMFKNAGDPQAAWEFLKWWTGAPAQTQYGKEIEILQGAGARWPTANLEALSLLPWSIKSAALIMEQESYSKGLPEIPGSYILPRYIGNAVKLTVNRQAATSANVGANYAPARETLITWVRQINDEIAVKYREFGLE